MKNYEELGNFNRYEINVSLNGVHLFATAKRSLIDADDLERCLKIFRVKFPEKEGYKLMVSGICEYAKVLEC